MKSNGTRVVLDGNSLTPQAIHDIAHDPRITVAIASKALDAVRASHEFISKEMKSKVVYGANTGFGPMASHILGREQLVELQYNLIRSHAAGIGNPIAQEYVLAAMVVRLNTLIKGSSGVSVELVQQLKNFINARIIPVVPEHGAVGTSGDLVQLAHIALALIGEGEVFYRGRRERTETVLKKLGIKPHTLRVKEGLSLINGTSVMSAIASLVCVDAAQLVDLSIRTGSWALELINGFSDSFSKELSEVRPHPGQVKVAETMRELLRSSKLIRTREAFQKKVKIEDDVHVIEDSVQEVYSFRCIPQIVGIILETLETTTRRVQIEINSVTDNPVINSRKKLYLHGGNFHGDYIAASIDQLKMGLVKLMMLSERRTNFLMNADLNRMFPPFMNLSKPGLTLGLQGLQFVATSTTAQSQTLAFPQYVHSIPTNADNQDIVSMGTDAALITAKVLDHAYIVVSIELLSLAQGVDFRGVRNKLAQSSADLFKMVRGSVPKIVDDRFISGELQRLVQKIKSA